MSENVNVYIEELNRLRKLSQTYKSDIANLARTNPSGVMPVQDKLETVAKSISAITQILQ